MTPEQHAQILRNGLDTIDRLSRHGLLVALDCERSKDNTDKLRRRVRLHWIKGAIHQLDLDNARNCEAMR
jgi:hypothetical protein